MPLTLAWVLTVASLLPAPAPLAPGDPRADPYLARPELRALMDWVTFQVTFDDGTLVPEMAAGDYKFTPAGTPKFAPGIKGLALQAGGDSGMALYSGPGNLPLATRGALTMWLCPLEWTHVNGGNTIFMLTGNGTFYLERQGPGHNAEGVVTRQEVLLGLLRNTPAGPATVYGDTASWPPGQWRLIVLDWDWPIMSLSINGQDFSTVTATGRPRPEDFPTFGLGSRDGEKTLMDEVTIFRRPLTRAEAQAMYDAFRPAG
jgi:hypothetical protein